MIDFFYYSGILFWVLIATYVLIVVRLWWIRDKTVDVDETDKPSSIHSGNITVASGLRCSKCGLIRPYWMNDCVCSDKTTKHPF